MDEDVRLSPNQSLYLALTISYSGWEGSKGTMVQWGVVLVEIEVTRAKGMPESGISRVAIQLIRQNSTYEVRRNGGDGCPTPMASAYVETEQ